MSAQRAHQLGLVSEIAPKEELLERAMWVAESIASAPPIAIQGTMKAVWTANDIGRRNALAQASSIVMLGTQADNLAAGQDAFKSKKREWRLR
jgi:enoyl-CoA hydratase/carnithine racemase